MGICRAIESHHIPGLYESPRDFYTYIYCDKCGSFDLEPRRLPYRRSQILGKIVAAVVALALVLICLFLTLRFSLCFVFALPYILLAVGSLAVGDTRFISYTCRKCGNDQLSAENPFHYDENVRELDVPRERVVKEFLYSEWPY